MAITKSIITQNVNICNADGTSQLRYELPETESIELTITPVSDTVGAGRTLAAAFDISGTVRLLNTNVYTDTRVYGSNTAAEPVAARIVFNGVPGALNMNVGPTIINARRDYSGNRSGVILEFTERVTNVEAFITES